jgi:hypothetical protein
MDRLIVYFPWGLPPHLRVMRVFAGRIPAPTTFWKSHKLCCIIIYSTLGIFAGEGLEIIPANTRITRITRKPPPSR